MASATLYPPILDGYIPAIAGNSTNIVVPFTFSKFNAAAAQTYIEDPDFTVHATVSESVSNMSAVDSTTDYAATGIILDLKPEAVVGKTDLYKVTIPRTNLEILSIGKKYKIQLRFSSKKFQGSGSNKQADWISANASYFSEWSTICIMKYTSVPTIQFKNPIAASYQSHSEIIPITNYPNENALFYGNFETTDPEEYLISYRIKLYSDQAKTILYDDSGEVEVNLNFKNTFNFELKKDMENNETYYADFTYTTNNFYQAEYHFSIEVKLSIITCDLVIDTIDFNNTYNNFTSISLEEDDGRVALFVKLKPQPEGSEPTSYTPGAVYRIKRYNSKDLFQQSEIIGGFTIGDISSSTGVIGPIYDDTIESGVYYKYGIQKMVDISTKTYTALNKTNELIRMFDFSFLVGYNKKLKRKQQLKLTFNQTIDNFSIVVNDSQLTTLGGKYPFVTRNGNTEYKQFPINGLISFNMDENKLFVDEIDIYGSQELKNKYQQYNREHNIGLLNDAFYEKRFRDFVLDFLYEDNVKLYKSLSEGNLLIRIINITCTPNQQLNRLIYSFSGTALEISDATLENYGKYKIFNKDLGIINSLLTV